MNSVSVFGEIVAPIFIVLLFTVVLMLCCYVFRHFLRRNYQHLRRRQVAPVSPPIEIPIVTVFADEDISVSEGEFINNNN